MSRKKSTSRNKRFLRRKKKKEKVEIITSNNVKPKRVVNKKIRNAIPTEIDGIKFRSRIEAFTYCKLLENNIKDFCYECSKFVIADAFIYGNDSYELNSKNEFKLFGEKVRGISYTPDFVCINQDTKTGWVIEVKGFATDGFQLRWKLFKKYLTDNNYNISLYKPTNQGNVLKCIELIKSKYYSNNEKMDKE